MGDDMQDFLHWAEDFDIKDDGLQAYRALKALEAIEFELTVGGEGYIDRIRDIASNAQG